MKTKTVLGLIAAALVAACSSTPRWDTAAFPNQVYYNESAPTTVAEASK